MKKNLNDINVRGKKVLMRVDYNVPLKDGVITDNTRIQASLPSVRYVLEHGGTLILMSHLGRPKGIVKKELSLKPCAQELERLLKKKVVMAPDSIGDEVKHLIASLPEGGVLMLENTRFYAAEDTKTDKEARLDYAKQLASLADIYVNDAFGTAHREHASTANVASFLPVAVSGFLLEKELKFLDEAIKNPKRPLVTIMGGAKVSDKIPLINRLLTLADKILIGGGMAFTFFKAMGLEIGNSLLDADLVAQCQKFLEEGKNKIVLPIDTKVGTMDFSTMSLQGELLNVSCNAIPPHLEGLDIGEATLNHFKDILLSAQTILWNGPMGVFECTDTAKGTFFVASCLEQATNNNATTIIGGGDSAAAVKQVGLSDKMTHISTGGGASLEFLEGKILPGIAFLQDK